MQVANDWPLPMRSAGRAIRLATIKRHSKALVPFAISLALAMPAFASEASQFPGNETARERPTGSSVNSQLEADQAIELATLYAQLGAYHMAYQQLFAVEAKTFHDPRITAMVRRLESNPRLSAAMMAEIRRQAESRWAPHED